MALEEFTLKKNGATAVTLLSLGVTAAALTLNATGKVSGADDGLRLTIRADAETAPIFARNDKLELFSGGVRRFVGWCKRSPRYSVAAEGERQIYEFESPNRFLRSTHKQLWYDADGVGHYYSEVTLNATVVEDAGGFSFDYTFLDAAVEEVLAYAQDFGNAGAAAPFAFDTAGIPTGLHGPENKLVAPSALDCIEQILKWSPSTAMRWDYLGTGDPVLRFVHCATIDGSGDPISPPVLTGTGSPTTHTLANDGTIFTDLNPEPSGHLVRQLEILWQGEETDGVDTYVVYYDGETSVIENGSIEHVSIPVALRGYYWDGDEFVDPEEQSAEGLAWLLHQGSDREWWDFEAETHSDDLHWEWRPGDLVNVTSAATAHASAYSSIQQITRDLLHGTVKLTTGTPIQRGLSELSMLKQVATSGGESTTESASSQTYGMGEPEGEGGGEDPPAPDFLIYFMQNGVATSRLFIVADPT